MTRVRRHRNFTVDVLVGTIFHTVPEPPHNTHCARCAQGGVVHRRYRDGVVPEASDERPDRPARESGVAAIKTHLTLAVGLALCAVAFWFELGRAERGNHLSWAYVFEWPLLAIFAVYMWWKVLHPEGTETPKRKKRQPELAPEYQGMLEAWQESQRQLEADRERERLAMERQEGEHWT